MSEERKINFLLNEKVFSQERWKATDEASDRLINFFIVFSGAILALVLYAARSPRAGQFQHDNNLVIFVVFLHYFIGLATYFRTLNRYREVFKNIKAINKIREYIVEKYPEIKEYIVHEIKDLYLFYWHR